MHVVATAGHVDHGKSTLVRALTGMEPDRWAEERRRGLTIDLGFAWTRLRSGREVGLVDVPGHERFLGNMLAGLGPAPVVLLVVAADEGWSAQTSDHRDALAALGISRGLLVVSKTDRAPDRVEEVVTQARTELAGTGLADAPAVAVSAATGAGLEDLRSRLDALLAEEAPPPADARVRLWVDRAFTIRGAGAVLTGTLTAGTLTKGDQLTLGDRGAVTVRGLHRHGEPADSVGPVSRVAVNVRGATADEVARGDVLLTPDAWLLTPLVDVCRVSGSGLSDAPGQVSVHVGTATVGARVRPFDDEHARLTLERPLPLVRGDRLVLRGPGSRRVLGGAVVLDAEPPALTRRGDGRRRAEVLAAMSPAGDVGLEVGRRGAVRVAHLRRLDLIPGLGSLPGDRPPPGVVAEGDWWVDRDALDRWSRLLAELVAARHRDDPLADGMTTGAAADALGLPDPALLPAVVAATGLRLAGGRVLPADDAGLGPAEPGVVALEERLRATPFAAPEADDLAALALGTRELAAAERAGRLLRLGGGVVLLPSAPALAMRELAGLEQPFTTSAARQALGVSRRIAIPLLEHLDARGWTRRVGGSHREVVR